RAERDRHHAAALRRNTDCIAVLIPDQHTLHHIAVIQPEKEFVGAVQPGHLPFKHLHREDNILFFQPLPKLFRQIGHLVKAVRKLHMQPFIDLSGAERLLSHFLHFSFHLIISKCADILFHCVSFPCLCCSSSCSARFTSLAMKNPSHLCTPGRSWRHPFSWTLSLSSGHRRSLMPS